MADDTEMISISKTYGGGFVENWEYGDTFDDHYATDGTPRSLDKWHLELAPDSSSWIASRGHNLAIETVTFSGPWAHQLARRFTQSNTEG